VLEEQIGDTEKPRGAVALGEHCLEV